MSKEVSAYPAAGVQDGALLNKLHAVLRFAPAPNAPPAAEPTLNVVLPRDGLLNLALLCLRLEGARAPGGSDSVALKTVRTDRFGVSAAGDDVVLSLEQNAGGCLHFRMPRPMAEALHANLGAALGLQAGS